MRCPYCFIDDDKVVDSRSIDDGSVTRRRRECLGCGRRFTTFERVDDVRLTVLKRSGAREPFDRSKVIRGIEAAVKNRRVDVKVVHDLVNELEESLRNSGDECTSSEIGVAVLDALHRLDEVAYLRFASVYKGFERWSDFEEEASLLTGRSLDKSTEIKEPKDRE